MSDKKSAKEAEKAQRIQDQLEMIKEINGEFDKFNSAVLGVDLMKATDAIIGITGEVQKLLKDGKLDSAIAHTVLVGGNVVQHGIVGIADMYKDLITTVLLKFDDLTDKMEGMEDEVNAVKSIWSEAFKENPKAGLKILKYKKKLKKAFKPKK